MIDHLEAAKAHLVLAEYYNQMAKDTVSLTAKAVYRERARENVLLSDNVQRRIRVKCKQCEDLAEPSGLCPACEAYKEHTS